MKTNERIGGRKGEKKTGEGRKEIWIGNVGYDYGLLFSSLPWKHLVAHFISCICAFQYYSKVEA